MVDQILARGRVTRGYLGVGLQPVELPDHHKGLIVLSLEREGPAAKAGVLVGDIFVKLAGNELGETEDVQNALESSAVGQGIAAVLLRGGVSTNVTITVGERPRRS